MFKIPYFYVFIALLCFWFGSDIDIGASPYKFEDNHFSLEFPKETFREKGEAPWVDFYWNASSSEEELIEIKESVVN